MKRTLRTVLVLTVAQLLGWAAITWLDYQEEFGPSIWPRLSVDLFWAVFLELPAALAALYLWKRPFLHTQGCAAWKSTLCCLLLWIAETAAIGFPVGYLVNYNRWIIPQASGGWVNFLNGIEYMLYPFFLAGIPFILVTLWSLGELLWHRFHRKK